MERSRWAILIALLLLFSAPAAFAQGAAKYTEMPDGYWKQVELDEQAEWLLKAWQDPTEIMKGQVEKVKAWNKAGGPELEGNYPAAFAAARDILMERRDEQGVRFVVVNGILALPEASRSDQMTRRLVDLLESDEQILVEKAALPCDHSHSLITAPVFLVDYEKDD